MKIFHLSHSDIVGGAARAAYRIHCALKAQGVDSTMFVNQAVSGDWTVEGPESKLSYGSNFFRGKAGSVINKVMKTENPVLHSPSILPSRWPRRLDNSAADVLNLHWVNGEMISIADIGRIKKPVVWTLHDMWAFCGAEHYTDDLRWQEGYCRANRPFHEGGFDLNRWTWARKLRHWRRPFHIVTPSCWLRDCVQESSLMREWPVAVIPYAIDSDIWKPIERSLARELLGLPSDVPLLLFGAMGGSKDPRKGFDLLQSALQHLVGEVEGLELVIFGQGTPKNYLRQGFPVHYAGHLHDDISLRLLYSAANAMAVPSRQDNLPLTVMESMSCGTPVVGFKIGGLPDMVVHHSTGFLAEPFDFVELASGIKWVLENDERNSALCAAARSRAKQNWSNSIVAKQYLAVYEQALENSC